MFLSRFQKLWPIVRSVLMYGAALGVLAAMMLVLAGVFRPHVPPYAREVTPPTLDTGAGLAEVRTVRRPRVETAVGTIRPIHEASVASRLLARVVEVNVTAGQTVDEGAVLVRLDDADLQARLEQAESAHAAASAQLEQATTEHERATQLLDRRAIAAADFDQAVAALKTATANLQRTRQAIDEARAVLEYTVVRAPMSGTVIDKQVEPGDTASPGQVLVTLYEPDRMQMVATVRESLAMRLKVGDEIYAGVESMGLECLATVSEIVPQADAASRSFTVKVTGPCPPGVYSGMFGRISIPLESEDIVVVPDAAVFHIGQLDLVDVAVDQHRQRRLVQLGRETDDGREVLAGLRPGERVVVRTGEYEQ